MKKAGVISLISYLFYGVYRITPFLLNRSLFEDIDLTQKRIIVFRAAFYIGIVLLAFIFKVMQMMTGRKLFGVVCSLVDVLIIDSVIRLLIERTRLIQMYGSSIFDNISYYIEMLIILIMFILSLINNVKSLKD